MVRTTETPLLASHVDDAERIYQETISGWPAGTQLEIVKHIITLMREHRAKACAALEEELKQEKELLVEIDSIKFI